MIASTDSYSGEEASYDQVDEVENGGEDDIDHTSIPLQNFFTLPFALHLRPLPHISYLAEQASTESSEAEFQDGSSDGSNYRAGMHRLQPVMQPVAPHSLSTITALMKRTGCVDAIPAWTQLLTLLAQADSDPHFRNLKRFFDARFDSEGELTAQGSDEKAGGESSEDGGLKVSAAHRTKSQSRSVASVTGSKGHRSRKLSSISRARSDVIAEHAEDSIHGEEGPSYDSSSSPRRSRTSRSRRGQGSSRIRSPKIIMPEVNVLRQSSLPPTETGEEGKQEERPVLRPVRFRVRLDLHNVNLAPPPPTHTVSRIASPTKKSRLRSATTTSATSAERVNGRQDGTDLGRVTSAESVSDRSFAGASSLYPVTSPDSAHSRQLSDGNHSSRFNRSTNGSTTEGNLSPTKPDMTQGGSRVDRLSRDDGKRRPSILAKLIGFGGRKGSNSSSRVRSVTGGSNRSDLHVPGPSDRDGRQSSADADVADNSNGRTLSQLRTTGNNDSLYASDGNNVSSPMTLEVPQYTSLSVGPQAFRASDNRMRQRSGGMSDYSNEEALDTADDEGSVGSSSWSRSQSYRRHSSSAGMPSFTAGGASLGAGGGKLESDLGPVHEGKVLENPSAFSDRALSEAGEEQRHGDEALSAFSEGGDFLTLLRGAADATLHLRYRKRAQTDGDTRTPKSSSTIGDLQTPTGSVEMENQQRAEAVLAAFDENGHEENPNSWWLCGSADPMPISISCALSQSMGWSGIMKLCYGRDSRCDQVGVFASLAKAAELDGKIKDEADRVRNWAQTVDPGQADASSFSDIPSKLPSGDSDEGQNASIEAGLPALQEELAPSESASAAEREKKARQTKLSKWLSKMPGRMQSTEGKEEPVGDLFSTLSLQDAGAVSDGSRTWQDWADLFASIAAWIEEYEICRIRHGMAREMDKEPRRATSTQHGLNPDSGFVEAVQLDQKPPGEGIRADKVYYSTLSSYQVPKCVALDALRADNGFRRRHGIPEGLPIGRDGTEHDDYRWARKKLSPSQVATPLSLAGSSLSYLFEQLSSSDWTYNSYWELDYLEMCVFHSSIVSDRFPAPSTSMIPLEQHYQPDEDDDNGHQRAMTCPYPRQNGAWDPTDWVQWLGKIREGMILVPAVSWQAWWTLIAILNGADGTGRSLDLQVKALEEPFSALDDMASVYI